MSQPVAGRWRRHLVLASLVRVMVVAGPAALAVGVCSSALRRLGPPTTVPGALGWLAGSLTVSVGAFAVGWWVARRLLPLAMLLKLALVFPDRAPSRLAIALRSANLRRLRAWSQRAARDGFPPDAGKQAEVVLTLVSALTAHDRRTRGHSDRVRALTDLVARELSLPEPDVQRLRWGAMLHDIGKLTVPERILNKPGAPSAHESQVLQRHPAEGARLAEPLSSWLGDWVHAIGQHHERWDGNGYPSGLSGSDISLAARIVTVTDSFETMTAVRAYKKPMNVDEARRELVRCAGSQFDPGVVRAFLGISLGRLRVTIGLAALIAQVPVIGSLSRLGTQVTGPVGGAAAARGAAAAAALAFGAVAVPGAMPASRHASPARATSSAAASDEAPRAAPSPSVRPAVLAGTSHDSPASVPAAPSPPPPAPALPAAVLAVAQQTLTHLPPLPPVTSVVDPQHVADQVAATGNEVVEPLDDLLGDASPS